MPRLLRQGVVGIAVTGSAARGTAARGSDLDLWILRPGPRTRRHLKVRGEPVTLLFDSPQSALELDWLPFWEVDDLLVLADPRGHFAAVQATFARHRARLRRDVLAATREDLHRLLTLARTGSSWRRVLFLREVGFRLGAIWLFRRTGWRVPRLRVLRAALPAAARTSLDRLLSLPAAAQSRPLLARAPRLLRVTQAQLRRHRKPLAKQTGVPPELRARIRAGELGEATHLLRRHLLQEVWPGVLAVKGLEDLPDLGRPGPLVRLTLELHGLQQVATTDPRPVRAAGRIALRLWRQLELDGALGRGLRRELERSALA